MEKPKLPEMYTQDELAYELGVTTRTLLYWRTSRKGPPHVRIGGRIRYLVDDVQSWIEQNVSAH